MLTFNGNSCVIHYNSDMSGELMIHQKPTMDEKIETEDDEQKREVSIDADDIIEFIGYFIKSELVGKIENMSAKEVLGLI